jgi:starch synthase
MSFKVLFVLQEITPYLPETEMSKIGRNLPQGIQEKGREIRTFMPKFGSINERRNQLHEVIRLSGMNLVIDDTDHPLIIKVASIQPARMQVYFIDNEDFFARKRTLTDKKGVEFDDNDERAIFFNRGVLETVKKLCWAPDIIHCHGWFSGLLPLYIKKACADDPLFSQVKVIYSVYDQSFKKPLSNNIITKALTDGVSESDIELLKNPNYENFNKLAIDMSDGIIQGSENIDNSMLDYIKSTKKPFLSYQSPEDYIEAYDKFYEELIK